MQPTEYKSVMTRHETFDVLMRHFEGCLRFWEKKLNVDSDLSNKAYIEAIREIPDVDPTEMAGVKLNPLYVAEFKKFRLMDCWGKEWQKHADKDLLKLLEQAEER